MSTDKYPSIFSRQMNAIVYILNTTTFLYYSVKQITQMFSESDSRLSYDYLITETHAQYLLFTMSKHLLAHIFHD